MSPAGEGAGAAARGVSFNPVVQYIEPPLDWDMIQYAEDESMASDPFRQPEQEVPEDSFEDAQPFDGNMSMGGGG